MASWKNWAGDQACEPRRIERPASREELRSAVARATGEGERVRVSGSGHSFTDIALTDGVMLRCDGLDRVLDYDSDSGLARVEAGIGMRALNEALDERGRALENLGDIDRQAIAGSISTATHGTGARFVNVSALAEGFELVSPDGELVEISADEPDELRAARVSLGALGPIYSVTLRTVPAFTINRVDRPAPLSETLDRLDEHVDGNDHFELYVFPHTETALLRLSRRTDEPPRPKHPARVYAQEVMLENWVIAGFFEVARRMPRLAPRLARLATRGVGRSTKVDKSYRVYASERRVRFTEMEYAIPREHAREAVERVLELAARPELGVAWPIEVRFVAADDSFLSPSHERDTCYIAVHQNRHLDWEPYFRGVEEIARSYDGRPHWGKRHFRTAADLEPAYPRWGDFQAVRRRLDPEGAFANAYTDRVLGPAGGT